MPELRGLEPGYYAISAEDVQQLHDTIQALRAALVSHLENRDAGVMDILSGLEAKWICLKDLEDLRESQAKILEIREIPVSEDEQLQTLIGWIKDEGQK